MDTLKNLIINDYRDNFKNEYRLYDLCLFKQRLINDYRRGHITEREKNDLIKQVITYHIKLTKFKRIKGVTRINITISTKEEYKQYFAINGKHIYNLYMPTTYSSYGCTYFR